MKYVTQNKHQEWFCPPSLFPFFLVETVGKFSPVYLTSQVFICDQDNEDRESGDHFPQHSFGRADVIMML